ncbi:MAG: hypothetical protein LBC37_02795, partial [Zoogloeaceae bacterium]|nr:hypothetical protein [Zoogloeaceae bacterium]
LIAIQNNINGIRDKLATTINLRYWKAERPSENTFPASRIGELVEEYRQPGKLGFSPRKAFLGLTAEDAQQKAKALLESASSGHAPIAAVMYDHIALVEDITGVICEAIRELAWYVAPPERLGEYGIEPDAKRQRQAEGRYRIKMVAELIEQAYESAWAQKEKIHDPAELEKRILVDTGMGWPEDFQERRSRALTAKAENYARHIDEKNRKKFLTKYDAEVKHLHEMVVRYKNNRCEWLKDHSVTKSGAYFGASFLRYDTEEKRDKKGVLPADKAASCTCHALAFASCTDCMVWGEEFAGIKDRERQCYADWMKTKDPEKNPVLVNMGYDNGSDERLIAWGLYEGMGGNALLEEKYQQELEAARREAKKAQQEADATGQKAESARQKAEEAKAAAQGAGKESQRTALAAKKALAAKEAAERVLKTARVAERAAENALKAVLSARNVAMGRLLEQTSVFIISRVSREGVAYTGVVRDKVAGYIEKLADGRISGVNAARLAKLLREKYDSRLTSHVMTPKDLDYYLKHAAGSRTGAVVRGSIASGMDEQMEVLLPGEASVEGLRAGLQSAQEQEADAQKLEQEARELQERSAKYEQEARAKRAAAKVLEEKLGSQNERAAELLREAEEAGIKAETAGIEAGTKRAKAITAREAAQTLRRRNPFLIDVHLGVASFLTALAVWNLGNAMDTLAKKRSAVNFSAFAAALATMGSALNTLANTQWAKDTPSPLARRWFSSSVGKFIAGIVALRLFGYGAAALDGVTYSLAAAEQFKAGNERAGRFYAGAAASLLTGGVMTTAAAVTGAKAAAAAAAGASVIVGLSTPLLGIPIWGWIVAGTLVLGVGVYCLFKGDDARFGPMNYWLDACVFGWGNIPGQKRYPNLEAELKAFHNAAFGPQLTDEDWDTWRLKDNSFGIITEDSLDIALIYPLPGSGHRLSVKEKHRVPMSLRKTETSDSGLQKHIYRIEGLEEIEELTLVASYVPDGSALGALTLEYRLKKK